MAFELPDLPYPYDALEPYMSSRTLHLHHDKHHQTYVTNLNNLIEDTDLKKASLEEIVVASAKDPAKSAIFNNAGQHWNHNLFWRIMKKGGGGAPGDELAKRIDDAFGSFESFKEQFKTAAVTQFGSGWGWLALDGDTPQDPEDPERRQSAGRGHDPAARHRRVGACLLPRLREPPAGVRRGVPEPPGQLGRGGGGAAQGRVSGATTCKQKPCKGQLGTAKATARAPRRAPADCRTSGVQQRTRLTDGIGSTVRRRLVGST